MSTVFNHLKSFLLGILLLSVIYSPAYARDNASPVTQVLNMLNNNSRISEFLDSQIYRNDISDVKTETTTREDGSTKSVVTFSLPVETKDFIVSATLLDEKEGTALIDLSFSDNSGYKKDFINLNVKTNVFNSEELATRNKLVNFAEILDKVESMQGHMILTRSKDYNDYMQVATIKTQDKPCLYVEYSEGFTPENKKIYRAEGPCLGKDKILQILYSYASGSDAFKQAAKWDQLKVIAKDANGNEQLVY